jgi:hypothetical protein
MKVTLTWAEMLHGAQIGVFRQLAAYKNKSKPGYGIKGLGWNEAIHGALGELAFAKAMKVYWDNMLTKTPNKRPDVGGYEVKTISERDYRLIVRDNDDDEKLVALVYGDRSEFEVLGWIKCGDAKQVARVESHQGREPQYYVDQKHLKSFDATNSLYDAWVER